MIEEEALPETGAIVFDEEAESEKNVSYLRDLTPEELWDVLKHIDPEQYPLRYEQVQREFARRRILIVNPLTSTELQLRRFGAWTLGSAILAAVLNAVAQSGVPGFQEKQDTWFYDVAAGGPAAASMVLPLVRTIAALGTVATSGIAVYVLGRVYRRRMPMDLLVTITAMAVVSLLAFGLSFSTVHFAEPSWYRSIMTPPDPYSPDHSVSHARRVLREEAEALTILAARLDQDFATAVDLLTGCKGRVVVTGMGKSGHVGRKIAATLASTGTPALFLHPAEALHGDLGMVTTGDVVLALSYSGETDELLAILPALRRRSEALIAITGSVRSTLGSAATVVLDVCVPKEACPMNLAPMTSTTAMIALGDALAVAVMEARGFGKEDYAQLHPAGSLGRRLLMRVEDVMRSGSELAIVDENTTLIETMFAITRAGAGAACIVDADGKLTGLLTEGDSRRYILKVGSGEAVGHPVANAMTRSPRVAAPDQLAIEALDRFEHDRVKFSEMPVVDGDGKPVGMLMLKDLIRTGIVLPDVNAG